MKKGFTLIELLIVVAIIAILAAIAIPNFLQAQTRAKVSRTRADLRSFATGLESYYVDFNAYPPMADYPHTGMVNGSINWGSWSASGISTGNQSHTRFPTWLTTPIAYLSSILYDPFIPSSTHDLIVFGEGTEMALRYPYFNYPIFVENNPDSVFFNNLNNNVAGPWLTYSWGPNTDYLNHPARPPQGWVYINYDPTNGTISLGNLFRTQMHPEFPPFEQHYEHSR